MYRTGKGSRWIDCSGSHRTYGLEEDLRLVLTYVCMPVAQVPFFFTYERLFATSAMLNQKYANDNRRASSTPKQANEDQQAQPAIGSQQLRSRHAAHKHAPQLPTPHTHST